MMKTNYRFTLASLILALGFSPACKAAEIQGHTLSACLNWGIGGVKVYGLSSRDGGEGSLNLALRTSGQVASPLITIRWTEMMEGSKSDPTESVGDFAVLIGQMAKWRYGYFSAGAGLGFVRGMKRGEFLYRENIGGGGGFGWSYYKDHYRHLPFRAIGLPVEAQIYMTPLKFVGIGVTGYANLNSKHSFAGVAIGLQIGKLF